MKEKILYVEDNIENRKLVRRVLEANHYTVVEAVDGISSIRKAQIEKPDLILMDIGIPNMNGHEATTRIKAIPELQNIPVIALTARVMDGDRERSLIAGCDGYISKPIDIRMFPEQIRSFLNGRREIISCQDQSSYFKEYNQHLVQHLEKNIIDLGKKNKQLEMQTREIQEVYLNVINSLTRAIEEKDPYTGGHSERVTHYALQMAEEMSLSESETLILKRASMLHDIGKLVIDLSCLNKEGPLTKEEWLHMSRHPAVGANILSNIKFLEREVDIILHHSERWDGTGYPDGLKGDEIDDLTSILILADGFDAMTTDRCYRTKMTIEEAVEEIRQCKGTHFNPKISDVLLRIIEKDLKYFPAGVS